MEIVDRVHKSAPKKLCPDAVHQCPREVTVVGSGQPSGKSRAIRLAFVQLGRGAAQELWLRFQGRIGQSLGVEAASCYGAGAANSSSTGLFEPIENALSSDG